VVLGPPRRYALLVASTRESTCARTRDLLPRRFDGELAPGELASVERHLDACPDCREEARLLERAAQALRELPADERARLRERTYRELGLEGGSSPSRARLLRALLFLLLFGLVYLWLRTHAPASPPLERPGANAPDAR
jgi:anti-sigma factor RsiW